MDPFADPDIAKRFRSWQVRTLVASTLGYVAFYFLRKNLSVAMPAMQQDLGISKADLGLFLTLHGVLYGVSKFINGFWGDRANARYFMVAGLAVSLLTNIVMGFSSAVIVLGLFWMINGWFQGMGFPPCARLMAHWFPPEKLATNFSIWNTSHSIGAGLVVVLCGYVVTFGWRWCFWAPSILVGIGIIALWFGLRDTPSSVGLPELPNTEAATSETGEAAPADFKAFVRRQVFGNPIIWIISIAQFSVYTLRYAVLDWGPTLLHEFKGYPLSSASWMVATFEIAGVAGMLFSGWATDKFFKGRGARLCLISMAMTCASFYLFWKVPGGAPWVTTALLACTGFFLYGPQCLVGTIAANLATKRAAATAIGFTTIFAYASTIVSGWALGYMVQHYGWNFAFGVLITIGLAGIVLFALAWPAKAHGYDRAE